MFQRVPGDEKIQRPDQLTGGREGLTDLRGMFR